jgi:hypothetical protein
MTHKPDTPETAKFLDAFRMAWMSVISDYEKRWINGEHTMQASLYRHLLDLLVKPNSSSESSFRIFTEASVKLDGLREKKVIDLLVVYGEVMKSTVIAAIELKFVPRDVPPRHKVKEDLTRLSELANRDRHTSKSMLKMPRFLSANHGPEEFGILPQKKLIFGAFCRSESTGTMARMCSAKAFWEEHRPKEGPWSEKFKISPPTHLGIAMAFTMDDGKAEPDFFGPIFEQKKEP